ncbi:MAG: cell division protein ZipA [Pseudomonadales bacterium]|nr:cell division protein ZipA [Pseudomonadales bacterium]
MDFDLRQWLLILGPVFIVGVLLHGYIRMRAGQNEIRMKLDKDFLSKPGEEPSLDDLNLLRAELPNGGARVIRADGSEVPVLMESVDVPSVSAGEPEQQELIQPAISAIDEPESPVSQTAQESVREIPKAPPVRKAPPAKAPEAPTEVEQAVAEEKEEQPEKPKPEKPKPEKFVVIHVLALDTHFGGQPLLEVLLDAGMTFGEMDIFHKLDAAGEPLFSLASAVEPGTFDMATMEEFSTPGVTFFMRVHELSDPISVLDDMLAVADSIALELGGELRDETRSVMTSQTIEHCRQSVQEFQFKHSA